MFQPVPVTTAAAHPPTEPVDTVVPDSQPAQLIPQMKTPEQQQPPPVQQQQQQQQSIPLKSATPPTSLVAPQPQHVGEPIPQPVHLKPAGQQASSPLPPLKAKLRESSSRQPAELPVSRKGTTLAPATPRMHAAAMDTAVFGSTPSSATATSTAASGSSSSAPPQPIQMEDRARIAEVTEFYPSSGGYTVYLSLSQIRFFFEFYFILLYFILLCS
jgi:hypothetical protein